MKKYAGIAALLLLPFLLYFSCSSLFSAKEDTLNQQGTNGPYFTGDGGKGMKLTVLEPKGRGLFTSEQWMLSLVQGSITGDLNKYTAMTIIDRQNLEQILAEQTLSLSGDYSDEDYISIGKLSNARYILTGSISRTATTYMLELAVSDVETGERKASYSPKPVTFTALEDLSAVKEATAELLEQLGVKLTASGLEELKKSAPVQVQAETALAKGIVAQKRGTEVAALSYYFQAAALNPLLLEASSRSSIISSNISGNIGADVRNDIQWRKNWIARLTETEEFFDDLFKNTAMIYTLFYSTEIEQGAHDYENETATFNINTNLHASNFLFSSVARALQTICDGLESTGRKDAWGLSNWPWQSITGLKPFAKRTETFFVVMELLNNRNKVIGKECFKAEAASELTLAEKRELSKVTWDMITVKELKIIVSDDDKEKVSISGIKLDDITDNLSVHILSVNGFDAQSAVQNGILQIKALGGDEWNYYNSFTMKDGKITHYNGDGEGGKLFIDTIWNDPVISIGDSVFRPEYNYEKFEYNYRLSSVIIGNSVISIGNRAFDSNSISNLIIGNSVKFIGREAFRNFYSTSVCIPPSVRQIGTDAFDWAFPNRKIKSITIGANVYLSPNAFTNDFGLFYYKHGYKAGTYTYRFGRWWLNDDNTDT